MDNRPRARRLLSVAVVMTLAFIAVGAAVSTVRGGAAQPSTAVTIGSGSGAIGDDVTVTLAVSNVYEPGLGSFVIDIDYDPDVVAPSSCVSLIAPGDFTIVCNTAFENDGLNPDTIRVGGFSAEGLGGSFNVVDLTFEVVGPGSSPLTLAVVEFVDPDGTPISHWTADGTITGGDIATPTPTNTWTLTPTATPEMATPTPTATPTQGMPEPGAIVEIGSGSAAVGESAGVRLSALDVAPPGLGAFDVDVGYDPAILEPTGCLENPDEIEHLSVLCNLALDNDNVPLDALKVVGFDTHSGEAEGDVGLADLTFECVGAGSSDLTLQVNELADTLGADMIYEEQIGSISCSGVGGAVVAVEPPEKRVYMVDGDFTVDVVVSEVTDLGAFEFTIEFDPAVVAFAGFAQGPFLGSTGRTIMCLSAHLGQGREHYGCASGGGQAGPSGSGVLATVTFSPVAIGSSALALSDLELADPFGSPIAAVAQDGQVTVSTRFGDVNGDCRIDIQDVQLVFAHWPSPPKPYDAVFDMNGDGLINIVDVQMVFNEWPKLDNACLP